MAITAPVSIVGNHLCMDVPDQAISPDLPALNAIVVVARMKAADLDEGLARRLSVTCFVGTAALNDRLPSIPRPGKSKARVAFGEDRFIKPCGLPRSAGIHAHLHGRDASSSAPGQSLNFTKPARDLLSSRRARDDRLGFHDKAELIGCAVRHQVGVL